MRFQLWLGIFGICCCLAGNTIAVSAQEIIQAKRDQYGRILLPIALQEGQERHFLFATDALRALVLNRDDSLSGVRQKARSALNHFSIQGLVRLPYGRVEALQLGSIKFEDTLVAFYPDTPIADGLLGNSIFHGRVLHWRPQDEQMHVYAHTAAFDRDTWLNLAGRRNRHFSMLIPTTYRGLEIDVMIATGSSYSMIDSTLMKELFPKRKDWVQARGELVDHAVGMLPAKASYASYRLPDVALDEWQLGDLEVVVTKLNVPEVTGYMNGRLLVLGSDVLANHELGFDFRSYQLWVKRSEGMSD